MTTTVFVPMFILACNNLGLCNVLIVPLDVRSLRYFCKVVSVPLLICDAFIGVLCRSTSRCSTSRTRTLPTLWSGSPTMSSPPSVTSPPRASRWPPPLWATQPPSRRCSSASASSSLPCSGARLSSTGTQVQSSSQSVAHALLHSV